MFARLDFHTRRTVVAEVTGGDRSGGGPGEIHNFQAVEHASTWCRSWHRAFTFTCATAVGFELPQDFLGVLTQPGRAAEIVNGGCGESCEGTGVQKTCFQLRVW